MQEMRYVEQVQIAAAIELGLTPKMLIDRALADPYAAKLLREATQGAAAGGDPHQLAMPLIHRLHQ